MQDLCTEELYFVNTFIVSNRRERMLWELRAKEKRRGCIDRFAHGAREVLKAACVHPVRIQKGEFMLGSKDFCAEIGNPEVLILHPDDECDCTRARFRDALDRLLGCGPYILIDCKMDFAFIETESGGKDHEFLYICSSLK